MPRRVFAILAAILVGYALGGLLGYVLVMTASPNTHDKTVEAAMTAAFVTGPIFAILAGSIPALRSRRKSR